MDKAYVLGVGMTKFAKRPEVSAEEMGVEAVREAVVDAGIEPRQIEAVYCGHVYQGMAAGQRIMARYGMLGMPVTNVENACSSGSCAFREAYLAVAVGRYDVALAIGVEKLTGKFAGAITPEGEDIEAELGLTFPALYALRARRYMDSYGLKPEHLAKIAVVNRKNAYYNDKCAHGELVTVEKVLNSRMIASPLHLYDCNPVSDGASAAVVVSEKVAKQLSGRPVEIAGTGLSSGNFEPGFIDMTWEDMTWRAAQQAYQMAGIGPEEVDFAEVHDCFTAAEILRVEGLGLCPRGGMVSWIEEGVIEIGGGKPINPSGGLLGKGHPLGATGVAQIREAVLQLRGDAGVRQIEGARVALTHCRGGSVAGTEGAACSVHVLRVA